jgi:Notch-like protein
LQEPHGITSQKTPFFNNIQALDVEGKKIIDQQSTAETFNEYFVTIAENIRKQTRYTHMHVNNNDVDNHIQFNNHAFDNPFSNMENKYSKIKEIEQIINSLKTKNSFGYDGISTKILKLSAPFISSPINYICNRMLSQGVFPYRLKYATVIPLHKKGDRRNMSHYRPVSLLTLFSKIFETVMPTRISSHFSKYNILSSEQYGFRAGLRTDDAIY